MEAAFATIPFNEPSTAEANLSILESKLSAGLWARLPTLLAQVPSPDDALNFLERYLREAPPEVARHLDAHPAALHYLLALFSHSRFLSESLVQQPELILWLDRRGPRESPEGMKSRDDLLEDCYRFSAMAYDLSPAVVLARFKRREYLRITLRDILGLASLSETALELSDLADALIERTLRLSAQRLENAYGLPQWSDATGQLQPARLTVISLGKLGGQELNYSSDIDLMFLYDHDGRTAGGGSGAISNLEYFVRLAQAILKMLTEATPEGAVFRIDMRLRPEGQQGDLATSLGAMLEYYRTRAREWEMQMLIKARVSAGELSTGEMFLREVHPLIYRSGFHLAAVEAVLDAREEISRTLRRGKTPKDEYAAEWNVKLSPGGIRDIEFLAQCLQRLHGGRDPWLTGRAPGSTLVALQRLHDKGYLSQRDFFRLSSAYQFLRKTEHRLQLRDGLQEHTLPHKAEALNRLARRCGVDGAGGRSAGEQLLQIVREHFREVRAIYQRMLPSTGAEEDASLLRPEEFLRRESNSLLAVDPLLGRLRLEAPTLAGRMEKFRSEGDSFVRRGAEKFLEAALFDHTLLEELEGHPDWLERAALLFRRSDLAAEMLARDPQAIRQVAEPEARPAAGLPFPPTMASLRIRHREALLRAIARSLLGESSPFETFGELTHAVEEALCGALALAACEEAPNVSLESSPFAVIALGRLGTSEFDIGSDADLVFFAGPAAGEREIEQWRRVAERFIRVAGSYTREGLLLPIDTRLRPRGGEGEIVQPTAYLLDYFSRDAEGWEAATYLKARPVGGNISLGANALAELREVLRRRFSATAGGDSRELARQLAHTRARLERERPEGPYGFKASAGGFFDIDYAVAYLTLSRGLLANAPTNVLGQISFLESSGALDAGQAGTLRSAALFYRSLDHAIRIVLGRPSEQLPEPAQLPRVAGLLQQWDVALNGTVKDVLVATRRKVRGIYEGIIDER